MDPNFQTIFALSSGQGRAGIAVVRMSGLQSRFVIETITKNFRFNPNQAQLKKIYSRHGDLIDTALVLFFQNPQSFTGEDCAEFQIHGGRAVIKALLKCLSEFDDCRMAHPGEFTRRALSNGKIDLIGAESLIDLIDAETEAQRSLALKGQSGRLQREIMDLKNSLLDVMALVEAGIDFSDEGDVHEDLELNIRLLVPSIIVRLEHIRRGYKASERLKAGMRVVLFGPVNAGKSTLLNTLAGRDVAIVSHNPGTTRDQIEVYLDLHGWPVIVTDTAGQRCTQDEIEIEGISRAKKSATHADVILNLCAADKLTEGFEQIDSQAVQINIITKSDICTTLENNAINLSSHTGLGIDVLLTRLESEADSLMRGSDFPVITQARQESAITEALKFLRRCGDVIQIPELLAEEFRGTVKALNILTGNIENEEILGAVFSRFCIGK